MKIDENGFLCELKKEDLVDGRLVIPEGVKAITFRCSEDGFYPKYEDGKYKYYGYTEEEENLLII